MKVPFLTILSIFGFPAVLLLHRMTAMAEDDPDLFMSDWTNTEEHPPLNRTDSESDYLNLYLAPPKRRAMGAKLCVRKEYRTLSEVERKALHDAFNRLKKTPVEPGKPDSLSQYDVLVGYHRYDVAKGAHFGPAFLPWHREFLCRLERALQQHNSSVCLPYVDWTMDQGIPVPSDSALWTSKYLGNNVDEVTSGFAANWKVYPKDCARKWPTLHRTMVPGSSAKNYLFTDKAINDVFAKTSYTEICVPNNTLFENSHNSVHVCIGGHMNILSCSPNDPTFFFHHSFVDCIWYEFRKDHQKTNLTTDYPSEPNIPDSHGAYDPMRPFDNLTNIDGLKTTYNSKIYICEPRPRNCTEQKDCKSDILWCNKYIGRCMAKIREGGRCAALPDEACYSEKCRNPKNIRGICRCP